MNDLYLIAGISKQGHFEAVAKMIAFLEKYVCYEGFMNQIRELHPGMGLRKMYEQFKPEGMGRDKFISLGFSLGFRLESAIKPHRTTYSIKSTRYKNLLGEKEFTDVNQVWVSDIFYFPFLNRHYYVTLIMDIYSRRIVGYYVADNMRAENNIAALKMAITLRGIDNCNGQSIHHSDRGSQYVSNDYTNLLDDHGIKISMCIDVLENAHSERANGTIKNEYLSRYTMKTEKKIFIRINYAIINYNNRKHNSIEMKPIQYEEYIKTISTDKIKKMTIFTVNSKKQNTTQIELFK
jgi:putative transposase